MKQNSNTTTKKNKNGGNLPFAAKTIAKGLGKVVMPVAESYVLDQGQKIFRNQPSHLGNIANRASGPSKPPKYPITLSRPGGRRRKSKRIRTRVRKTRKR